MDHAIAYLLSDLKVFAELTVWENLDFDLTITGALDDIGENLGQTLLLGFRRDHHC